MHQEPVSNDSTGRSALIPLTTTDDGVDAVMGRDLHDFLGIGKDYSTWFKDMAGYGFVAGQDFSPISGKTSAAGGRPRTDHIITLDMAKEIAMIQRTDRGRQARQYFIECERRLRIRPSTPALPQDYASALRELADQYERAEMEAARARELEAPAKSWEALAAPGGDYSVAGAAKTLSRDPRIEIGRDRLFRFMHELGWIYRTTGKRAHWEAYQDKGIKPGRLVHKLGGGFINEKTGEWEQTQPTVRITPKGLHELHKSLGGSDQMILSLEAIA